MTTCPKKREYYKTAMESFDRMHDFKAITKVEGLQLQDRFGQTKAHPLTTVERDSRGGNT
mgnify:CR=1 FL=1